MKFQIIETKTVPTVQSLLTKRPLTFHSKYDPLKEAQKWAQTAAEEVYPTGPILVIGFAAGYHIQQLAEQLPGRTIYALEFNEAYNDWFHMSPFLAALQSYPHVTVLPFTAIQERKEELFSTHSSNVRIHKSALDILPTSFHEIRELLLDIQMGQNSFRIQKANLFANFKKNQRLQDAGIQSLANQYKGKKGVLVAAGPSLDKQLPALYELQKNSNFVIGAVGTALQSLVQAGITPDFFCIIDPNEGTLPQLQKVSLPETPFFYMSTAYHNTVLLHTGPRFIFFQHGVDCAEEAAKKRQEPLIQTGGSVATALLDLFVYFGIQKIALVGQDLAYTNNQTHSKEANANQWRTGTLEVLAWDGESTVTTDRNLNSYKKWFERYAARHTELELWDCTEGGARIQHMHNRPFHQFLS